MKKMIVIFVGAIVILISPKIIGLDYGRNLNYGEANVNNNMKTHEEPVSTQVRMHNNFLLSDTTTWSTFPMHLKEYSSVYLPAENKQNTPVTYNVTMPGENGEDMFAVYSSVGNLISSRQIVNNANIPAYIIQKLSESIYKDWNIIDCKQTIRYYNDQKSVVQYFKVTISDGNNNINLEYKFDVVAAAEMVAKK